MADFLLELFSEEIPARMQAQAAADLARLFGAALAEAGVTAARIDPYVTPRRLALMARGLPISTAAVSEERRGPRADAPAQAIDGFLKSTGLTRDQLEERDDPKGRFLYAVIEKPGRATAAVIGEIVPAIIRTFPWPKSMRWGTRSRTEGALRWVRPLHGIVALLDEALVDIEIDGLVSGRTTRGHRFLSPGAVEIASAASWAGQLRKCHVIVDPAERRQIIADGAAAAAKAAGLALIPDDGLLAENAGLTEWPVPLLGRFDPAFLDVPPEVIQLTMRVNQKYFACEDPATGKLAPAFVCVANTEASDGGAAIIAGNRKVLAARLSDAKFFWEQDRKTTLESRLPKLADIVFHEKLGTVADKVERVAKLARWLVESGAVVPPPPTASRSVPLPRFAGEDLQSSPAERGRGTAAGGGGGDAEHLATLAEQAARLCKADLVTAMVGEFPELQGIMGGYYARAEGLPVEVADAIRDHYKPLGQGDEVPTAPVTVAVSLADKLDTLAGFFAHDMKPTGSKDPFALRRAAIGVVSLLMASGLRLPLGDVLFELLNLHLSTYPHDAEIELQRATVDETLRLAGVDIHTSSGNWDLHALKGEVEAPLSTDFIEDLLRFFADRLKVQQREAGVRHDLIDAVFALGGEDDLVRLLARVKALQAFVTTEDGTNLLAGYKRAANILRIEEKKDGVAYDAAVDPALLVLPEEVALADALAVTEREAASAVAAEDFAAAMAALATLRPAVDAFFDKVIVNDAVPERRANRLRLLNRIRAAVHSVADFSKIEG